MSEENTTEEVKSEAAAATPSMDELIAQAVEERLSKVKENLDKAYGERDKALQEAEELKKAKQDVEIRALEDAGKATEALEMRLKQQEEAMAKLLAANTALTRDTQIKDALAGFDFASEKAALMASNDLTGSVTRGEDGVWRGANGESISEMAKNYASDENNGFLFKQVLNSGSATMPRGNTASSDPKSSKPLSEMSTQEAIQAAAEGRLGADKTWY